MLAIIGAINGIAPVVAPIIGGVFTEAIGWQGIFIILLVLGVLLLIGCMRLGITPGGKSPGYEMGGYF